MSVRNVSDLRLLHPTIHYRAYSVEREGSTLSIEYSFLLAPDIEFSPRITIPWAISDVDPCADRIVFLTGLVELISYWKLACPAEIIIECGALSEREVWWWKNLWRNGLGEFFFVNRIDPLIDFEFRITAAQRTLSEPIPSYQSADSNRSHHESPRHSPQRLGDLVLIGGGKDSLVTLETLRGTEHQKHLDTRITCFMLNPIPASLEAVRSTGSSELIAQRTLDPKLRALNTAGYLNGHTPFSALLAFVATLAAYGNGFRRVLASNESSASEGNLTIGSFEVNHQYSKSLEFERAFREYPWDFEPPIEYLSFLRPLNELQIGLLFSKLPVRYHQIFRSCNRGQTADARSRTPNAHDEQGRRAGWCGECPKCVFTALMLGCFLPVTALKDIFGICPFSRPDFLPTLRALAGRESHKPLECVGTYEEVRCAALHLSQRFKGGELHALSVPLSDIAGTDTLPLLHQISKWDGNNFLSARDSRILHQALDAARHTVDSVLTV
jgi:hypothetical protein